MRRAAYKLGILMMIAGLLGVYGCGSSDVLGEVGQRYVSSMVITDNDAETLDIDVVQDMCDTDPESFTNVHAEFTVAVATNAAGLTLQRYSIQYIPLDSPDGTGNVVQPPPLISPADGYSNFDVAQGATNTLTIECMSIDTKEEYVNGVPAGLNVGRYTIRITFYFQNTAGEEEDIVMDRTVYLANFDNC